MPNPILNDKKLEEARSRLGRARSRRAPAATCGRRPADRRPPIDDGPVSPWRAGMMTVRGSITATAVLFVLLLASATVGWMATEARRSTRRPASRSSVPGLALVGVIVGFVVRHRAVLQAALGQDPRPDLRPRPGLLRRRHLQGLRDLLDGIVLQAAGATLAVFAVMLLLYNTRIIKVTDRFRRIVIFATLGVMAAVPRVVRDQLVRRRRCRSSTSLASRHRLQRLRLRPRGVQPGARLRLHRAGLEGGPVEGLRVGRPPSACSSPSSGCTSRSCACWPSCARTDRRRRPAPRRRPSRRVGRPARRRAALLGGAVVVAASGSGGRRRSSARPTGRSRRLAADLRAGAGRPASLAFVLDSTWALADDGGRARRPRRRRRAAATGAGIVAGAQRAGQPPRLRRGLPAAPRLRSSRSATRSTAPASRRRHVAARRQQLVTDHEDVHVWQGRWFGPLYPLLYVGWMVAGGAVGARRLGGAPARRAASARSSRRAPTTSTRSSGGPTAATGSWPPPAKVAGLGWQPPVVRPFSDDVAAAGPSEVRQRRQQRPVERLRRLLLRPVAGALDQHRAAVVGQQAAPSPRRSPGGRR